MSDLGQYKVAWFPRDLIAGLSVAAVQVPTAIAYAQLAGFSTEVGLYASIFPIIVYAFLGSSRQLVLGPDAATCAMVASLISPLANGDPVKYVALSSALSITAGIFMLLGGMTGLGFIVNFFARPILIGFLNGIGVSIIAGQLGKFLGVIVNHHDFIPSVLELTTKIPATHALTALVGAATILLLVLLNRLAPKAPSSLIALAAATACLYFFGGSNNGVNLIGAVPTGLPHLHLPQLGYHAAQHIFVGAIGLVIVSFTSGMLTCRSFAARSGQTIDANREMLAIGAANLAAGFSGSFAVTGADSRTAVNVASGNKTQLSSVISALSVACVAAFLAAPLGLVPISALAAVLIFSAIKLLDFSSYNELRHIDRNEFRLSILTTVGVLTMGVLPGVAIAVLLALISILLRIYNPRDTILGQVPDMDGYNDVELSPDSKTIPGVLIWRFEAPLVFFNADRFKARVKELSSDDSLKWFVISLESISQTDATGVKAMEEVARELKVKGIKLLLARPKSYMRHLRENTGLSEHVAREDVFPTIRAAIDATEHTESKS